ncbi:hypothetical protein CJ255_19335, partial [Candidatus Viridilinea mediisalina]
MFLGQKKGSEGGYAFSANHHSILGASWSSTTFLRFPTIKLLELETALLEASRNMIAMVILIHRDAQATQG